MLFLKLQKSDGSGVSVCAAHRLRTQVLLSNQCCIVLVLISNAQAAIAFAKCQQLL